MLLIVRGYAKTVIGNRCSVIGRVNGGKLTLRSRTWSTLALIHRQRAGGES
jgi:hypothetical protein